MSEKVSNAASKAKSASSKAKTQSFVCGIADAESFMESDTLITSVMPLGEAVGEGIVSGFGCVDGLQTAIVATNADVLKGGIGSGAAIKISRLVDRAVKAGLPIISVIDTQGARFGEGAAVLDGYGKILASYSRAQGIVPTVCVIKGSNYGMLSLLTAISDITIAFDKSSMATSSPLILAADGKEDVQKIGTATVHAEKSGAVSVMVSSEEELRKTVRAYLKLVCFPILKEEDELSRMVKGFKSGTNPRAFIGEVVDKNSFLELKARFAPEIVTGIARLGGITVGIIAGNAAEKEGRLTEKSAQKALDLLKLCSSYDFPIVNLTDCVGMEKNLEAEYGGLIRSVGNLVKEFACAKIGKISLVCGKAIGIGYTAFCSRDIYDYTMALDCAEIGVLPSAAAAELLYSGSVSSAKDKKKAEELFRNAYEKESMSANSVAVKGLLDNVIKPEFARSYLINAVQTFVAKE